MKKPHPKQEPETTPEQIGTEPFHIVPEWSKRMFKKWERTTHKGPYSLIGPPHNGTKYNVKAYKAALDCAMNHYDLPDREPNDRELNDCELNDRELNDRELNDCVLHNCVLNNCVLNDCVLNDCVLNDCVLTDRELNDCVLNDCELGDCVLHNCALNGCVVNDLDLGEFAQMAVEAMVNPNPLFFEAARLAARELEAAKRRQLTAGQAREMALGEAKRYIKHSSEEPTIKSVRELAIMIFEKWFTPRGLKPPKDARGWKPYMKAAGLDYLKPDTRGAAKKK